MRTLLQIAGFAACVCLARAIAVAQETDPASATDKVTVLLGDGAGRISITGEVLDYTGKSLRIRAKGVSAPRDYPSAQVVDVATTETPQHARGTALFRDGKLAEAKAAFEEALNAEPRQWVRREILAMLVRCALAQGDHVTAGLRFFLLAKSDPDTLHYRLAPLRWEASDAPADLKAAARQWKNQPGEAAQLLAASVLLFDDRDGKDADFALRRLASSTNDAVHHFATAQAWRRRLVVGDTNRDEILRWQTRVEEMPERLRGGPYYIVGTAHRVRREYDRAAACLLWLPILYADNPFLAARAGVEAGDSLVQIGQRNEAATIYREVSERFRGTPFAQEAADALSGLKERPGR